MYSLYLQKCDTYELIGHYENENPLHDYVAAYQKNKGFEAHYVRMFNEEAMGQLMTCVDFGSWSEFFYISPVLEWMKPI